MQRTRVSTQRVNLYLEALFTLLVSSARLMSRAEVLGLCLNMMNKVNPIAKVPC